MARRINMRRLRNAVRKGNPIPPKALDEYTPDEHAKALDKVAADAKRANVALAACRALVEAYQKNADGGGSVDWSDVDEAHRLAETALAEASKGRDSRFIDAFEIDATALQWEPMNPDDEDAMLGTCQLAGVGFHVMAIHVEHDEDGQLVGIRDPYDRVDDINHLDDCAFQTVEIPGYEGEWLVVIHPFGT